MTRQALKVTRVTLAALLLGSGFAYADPSQSVPACALRLADGRCLIDTPSSGTVGEMYPGPSASEQMAFVCGILAGLREITKRPAMIVCQKYESLFRESK